MHKLRFEERLTLTMRLKKQHTHSFATAQLLVTLSYTCNYYKSKNSRFTQICCLFFSFFSFFHNVQSLFFPVPVQRRKKELQKNTHTKIYFNEISRAFISTVSLARHKCCCLFANLILRKASYGTLVGYFILFVF